MSTLSQFTGGTIKRIQRGTIEVDPLSTTATITLPFAVDPTKSVLSLLGSNTATVADASVAFNRTVYLEITGSGTTLTASGASAGSGRTNIIQAWQIVEYN